MRCKIVRFQKLMWHNIMTSTKSKKSFSFTPRLSSTGSIKLVFFLDGTILDASSRRRGSYAWQSIMKARDIIINGACWRVGDGSKIKIWNHR